MGKGKKKGGKGGGFSSYGGNNPSAGTRRPSHGSIHNEHSSHQRSTISKKQKKKQQRREQADKKEQQPHEERESKSTSSGCPYSSHKPTLLLGEGDFSFAAALALVWGDASQLVATAYDEEAPATIKYSSLAENVEAIRSLGGTVLFGVDAMKAAAHKQLRTRAPFDRIIFNFPHTGSGIKDQKRNILSNQELLRASFQSCDSMLNACG